MKYLFNAGLKNLMLFGLVNFVALVTLAQDSSSTTTTTVKNASTTWYTQPWVWIIGIAVFILLLIALLRGGGGKRSSGSTDKVTVTKSVNRDSDTA